MWADPPKGAAKPMNADRLKKLANVADKYDGVGATTYWAKCDFGKTRQATCWQQALLSSFAILHARRCQVLNDLTELGVLHLPTVDRSAKAFKKYLLSSELLSRLPQCLIGNIPFKEDLFSDS